MHYSYTFPLLHCDEVSYCHKDSPETPWAPPAMYNRTPNTDYSENTDYSDNQTISYFGQMPLPKMLDENQISWLGKPSKFLIFTGPTLPLFSRY